MKNLFHEGTWIFDKTIDLSKMAVWLCLPLQRGLWNCQW